MKGRQNGDLQRKETFENLKINRRFEPGISGRFRLKSAGFSQFNREFLDLFLYKIAARS